MGGKNTAICGRTNCEEKFRLEFSRDRLESGTDKLYEVCHEKTDLCLCRCHTKRRMGTHGRADPSFGMTPTF